MTDDEHKDLHEQAAQFAYLAIRLADLSPLLSSEEWDAMADELGREMVRLALGRIDRRREEIEELDREWEGWLAI